MDISYRYTRRASGGEGLAQKQILEEIINEIDEGQHKGVIWRGFDIFNCVFSNF